MSDYKYIEVPNQYEFQHEPNEYRLNDLAVFELKKKGYEAFKSTSVQPQDKNIGACNTLVMDIEESGILSRSFILNFKNCDGEIVYSTIKGTGREKDNQKAYFTAMRETIRSMPEAIQAKASTTEVIEAKIPDSAETQPIEDDQQTKFPDEPATADRPALKFDYAQKTNQGYGIVLKEAEEVEVYNNDKLIGSGQKSSTGFYLIETKQFNGVGIIKDEIFIIEYRDNGELVRVELHKTF
ncbi:hypothetical protein BST97_09300 [Nonlabens spongiae]|uniref:Uncharacterized protein n=1 Tax=Nonlabens spongiae TaxID=331648 RepID=A0A1W6MKM8_9FLAO|nr:hypothetical protein BST97_09300 [Nonlabens spongiae]